MNIDIEELKERLCMGGYHPPTLKLITSCEIKVDCDSCRHNSTVSMCGRCMNHPSISNYYEPKPKEWYEKPESFPCLCWISNVDKNPSDYISVIDRHHKENRGLGAFSLVPGGFVKFATPLTKEEVLKYCVGEK